MPENLSALAFPTELRKCYVKVIVLHMANFCPLFKIIYTVVFYQIFPLPYYLLLSITFQTSSFQTAIDNPSLV